MDAIGPLQLRVMHFIWRQGATTVRSVHAALNAEPDAVPLAYTTILTVMRTLARRRMLEQRSLGRHHLFTPLIGEEAYKLGVLRQIRRDLFDGDVHRLLAHLARDVEIAEDVREIFAAGPVLAR